MSSWNGVATCPKCGSPGTLIVHGETSTLEIDGCWVCGYGRESHDPLGTFVPLKNLRVRRPPRPSSLPQK